MGRAARAKKVPLSAKVLVDDDSEKESDESSQEVAPRPQQKRVEVEPKGEGDSSPEDDESSSDSEPPPRPALALPRKSDPEPPNKARLNEESKEKAPRGKKKDKHKEENKEDKESREKKEESKEKEKDKESNEKKDKNKKKEESKEKEEVASKDSRKGKKQPNASEKSRQEDEEEKKPPPAAAAEQAVEKPDAATDAPQQPKVSTAKKSLWGGKDESLLAQQLLEELKTGSDFHNKPKTDVFWEELCQSLKGKLSHEYTKEQIFDKHRRMKMKFDKYESSKPGSRKRSHAEDALHAVFKQLWGRDLPADMNVEESNGDIEMTPAKNDAKASDDIKAAIRASEGQAAFAKVSTDPVLTIAMSLLHSVMTNHKVGSEYMRGGGRENRKRHLEEQIAEYSSMKRRLKLAMDYCELEAELLEKKLNSN